VTTLGPILTPVVAVTVGPPNTTATAPTWIITSSFSAGIVRIFVADVPTATVPLT
jgi:hypothetical protein